MFIIISLLIMNFFKDFWMMPFFLGVILMMMYLNFSFSSLMTSCLFMDKMSFYLVFLSMLILTLMYFASTLFYFKFFFVSQYNFMLNFLGIFLVMSFVSLDFMNFYIWFESSLIPIFLMVYGWGVQPERLEASMYLMGYTLMGSFPLFIFIVFLNNSLSSTNFFLWYLLMSKSSILSFHLFIIYSAFLVKIPMFMLHLWLPKVHVEASLSGSMILAAILLKLGAYGVLRMMYLNFLNSSFLLIFSILGGAYVALFCLRQTDLKTLVAYSSVVHMSFIIGGCFSEVSITYLGALLMMVSHGLSSSCLFYLVNFYYERTGSRNILINKGMSSLVSIFSLWWLIFSATSISTPFSLNFFSEILLLLNIITHSKLMLLILTMLSMMTSCYVIYMFMFSQSNLNSNNFNLNMEKMSDHMVCLGHATPLLLSVLFMNMI